MANVNRPLGFVPVKSLNGAPWNGAVMMVLIPSTDGTAIGVGDLIIHGGSSGAAGVFVNGQDCEGMPTALIASAGTTGQNLLGAVVGFLPDQTNLALIHRAASTNRIALVPADPNTVYECQEDADTTPIAAASIGLNVSYTTTALNTTTGQSKMELDSSAVNTTATLPIKIIGLVKSPDNAFNTLGTLLDKAKFLVTLNTHYFAKNVLGN